MQSFTLSTTEREKPLLIHHGFHYTIERRTNDKIYWKCQNYRKFKCKGRVHTDIGITNVQVQNADHNHFGDAIKTEVLIFQDKIRSRSAMTNETTQNIIDNCLHNVTDEMVARLPNFRHIRRNIQRQRQQNDLPALPIDRNFNSIPTSLTVTDKNELFLRFDSGPGDHRLLLFASTYQLNILESTDEILIDGTFKV